MIVVITCKAGGKGFIEGSFASSHKDAILDAIKHNVSVDEEIKHSLSSIKDNILMFGLSKKIELPGENASAYLFEKQTIAFLVKEVPDNTELSEDLFFAILEENMNPEDLAKDMFVRQARQTTIQFFN